MDPTPATTAPAALAQDVLHALGKTCFGTPAGNGAWADSLTPAWMAVRAWILALHISGLTVTRAHRLTEHRLRQLLHLREHTGIHLTLLWHTRPTPTLRQLLAGIDHHTTRTLTTPTGTGTTTDRRPPRMSFPWLDPPQSLPGLAVPRARRSPCQGVEPLPRLARPGTPASDGHAELADRLHTLAHPLHAAALTTTLLTGAGPARLALIRGTDVHPDGTHVKVHDPHTHHRCRIHALPAWAHTLITAAHHHHQDTSRPPTSALYPLITARDAATLTEHATSIHIRLPH
ncbi:hypothetical protein [Streptomyces sp. TBY4]|uniref:hypothetical protein n=1 Tax=Streptomyces sp. TBY4 TaxID=2962030 RepID=UPI0020B78B3C|nr:hypothetical protein [Streptomyces sp. TBY4]MCP3759390.1 hypothetical protein [Streptomyces sp. TBY4]